MKILVNKSQAMCAGCREVGTVEEFEGEYYCGACDCDNLRDISDGSVWEPELKEVSPLQFAIGGQYV